jgi:hypothetical protein
VQAWCERVAAPDGYVNDLETYPPNAPLGRRPLDLRETPLFNPDRPLRPVTRLRGRCGAGETCHAVVELATVRRRMLGERVVMVTRPGLGGHRNE